MKTFLDLITAVQNRVNDNDTDSLPIIKQAVNEAYFDLSPLDKRIATETVTITDGMGLLPDNIETLIDVYPALSYGERIAGNAILSYQNSSFDIIYSTMRSVLANNTDTVDMKDSLANLIVSYGCAQYYDYRKKTQLSQYFMQRYESGKDKYSGTTDESEETVRQSEV